MSIALKAFALLLAILANTANAASTNTVVDVPTRGTTVRILHLQPAAATINLIVLVGGEGVLGIRDDGSFSGNLGTCNPATRNGQAFADHGYAVALVDAARDLELRNYADLVEIVRYMQSRNAVPTWVLGGSTATEISVDFLSRVPLGNGLGAVFYSPEEFIAGQAALITRPSLTVYHPLDPRNRAASLVAALTAAPVNQLVSIAGGNNSGCSGYHTLNGVNAAFLSTVFGFIDTYNPTLTYAPLASSSATAVEFYNASLNHYFVTHIANEIALLDAGVTIKGWVRTGQSFNVYPAAQGSSSPVCRYYIPPNKGDSHFYGRGAVECDGTGAANPTFVNEDPKFFHVILPNAGNCPGGTVPVYRVFSNRPDANHRYMVNRAVRDQMTGAGWLAEGDGPDLVVMCVPG